MSGTSIWSVCWAEWFTIIVLPRHTPFMKQTYCSRKRGIQLGRMGEIGKVLDLGVCAASCVVRAGDWSKTHTYA